MWRSIGMMWATIRRKALSAGSAALANNGIVQSLERGQPAIAGSASRGYIAAIPMFEALNLGSGSKVAPEFHQGPAVRSKSQRDVSSHKRDFPTQMWIRSFSSYIEPAVRGDISESIVQMETNKGIAVPVILDAAEKNFPEIEKPSYTPTKTKNNGPALYTASGGVLGSILSTPAANAPQAAKLGMASTVSSTFLPNLALFWHINNGIEEILADYVHHEMTRSLILVLMRLFLIVAAKDVFVATN